MNIEAEMLNNVYYWWSLPPLHCGTFCKQQIQLVLKDTEYQSFCGQRHINIYYLFSPVYVSNFWHDADVIRLLLILALKNHTCQGYAVSLLTLSNGIFNLKILDGKQRTSCGIPVLLPTVDRFQWRKTMTGWKLHWSWSSHLLDG